MALVAGYGSSSEEDEDDAAPDNKLGSLVAYGDDDDDDDDDGGNNGATAKAAKSAEAPQSTSGDGGAAAATAASAAASSAASTAESWQPGKGDTVIRKGQECIVIHIDYALDPPGYTLRLPDGREVGTELNRLERPAATVAATAKSERRRTEDRTDASRSQAVGPAIGTAATASAATAVRSGGSRSSRSSRIKKGVEEEEEEEEKVLLPPEPEGLPAEPAGSCDRDLAKKLAQFHALRAEGNNFTATLQSKREFGNPYILQKAKDHFAIDGAGSNYPRETFDPQAFGSGEFIEQLEARRRRREEQLAAERNMRQMQGAVHHLYNAAAPAQAPAPAPALAPAPAPAPPVPAAAPVVAPVMPGTIAGAGAGAAGGDGGSAATAAAPALASHGGNTGGARKRKKREWGTVAGRR